MHFEYIKSLQNIYACLFECFALKEFRYNIMLSLHYRRKTAIARTSPNSNAMEGILYEMLEEKQ